MAKTRKVGVGQGIGGGRPLKFETVPKLQEAIDAYFLSCYDYVRDMWGNRIHDKEHPDYKAKTKKNPGNPIYVMKKVKAFTVTGLALALDTSRETLLDYEHGKYDDYDEAGNALELTAEEQKLNAQIDKFSDTIKRAKLRCYEDTEQYLFVKGTAPGAKFSLVNNYGWEDKQTIATETEKRNSYEKLSEDELRRIAAMDQETES